jgi:hypothetical protein
MCRQQAPLVATLEPPCTCAHTSSQPPQWTAAVVAQMAAAGQRTISRAIQARAVNPIVITAFSTLLVGDPLPVALRMASMVPMAKVGASGSKPSLLHFCCAQQSTSRSWASSRPHHELGFIFCQPVRKCVTLHDFRPLHEPRHDI